MTSKERAFLNDYGKLCLQYGLHLEVWNYVFGTDLCIGQHDVSFDLTAYLNEIEENSG